MTKKQALRFTAFVLLAGLMILAFAQLLRDRETTLSSFYSEPKGTVEAIVVGSSHVNSGVMPAALWQEYGINAHNVFSWSQPMWISYYYIQEALKTQTPKVVVLDLYGAMYGNSNEQPVEIDKVNYANSFSIDIGLNYFRMLQTVKNCGIDLRNPVDFMNIVRYHTRWKYLDAHALTYNAHNDESYLKGFGPLFGVKPCAAPDLSVNAAPRMPYDTALHWLDKIVQLCKNKKIPLVFTMLPYQAAPSEREVFAYLREYAQQNDIAFFNYCEADGERIGFNYATDMADEGHVNYHGAYKLTRDLGAYLQENVAFSLPETLPNAPALSKSAAQVYRVFEANENLFTEMNALLNWLKNDKNTVLLMAHSGKSGQQTALCEAMARAGAETPGHAQGEGRGYTAMMENGQWTKGVQTWQSAEGWQFALAANETSASITLDGIAADYPKDAVAVFAIYDKILARPTFYFTCEKDQFVFKNYPAKLKNPHS